RAAQAHDQCSFHLVFEVVGVDDGAAFEGGEGADHFDGAAVLVGQNLGAGRQVGAFFGADGEANAASVAAAGGAPAEGVGGGQEDGDHAGVFEVFEAEIQRVHFDGEGQFVHVRFAGEMIGGGGQGAVGALA